MLKISFKKANFSDIEFLWYLRNRPDVYKYSRKRRTVSWQEHINWIMPIILGFDKKDLFVIRNLGHPVGQVRLDYGKNREAEVNIAILKEWRERGIASNTLELAIRQAKKKKKAKILTAEVFKNNIPSIKLFGGLGFKLKSKKGNRLKYILRL